MENLKKLVVDEYILDLLLENSNITSKNLECFTYEILDFLSTASIRKFHSKIKNKRFFNYFIKRRRIELIKQRQAKTRVLLQKKQIEEELTEIRELMRREIIELERPIVIDDRRVLMLMFRSATIQKPPNEDDEILNKVVNSKSREENITKLKNIIQLNVDDILDFRYKTKKINEAFLPELIYKTDSKIQISKPELIRIIKVENKLRISENSKKRNDYFFGCRLMSEIDQDFIVEALRFYGFSPEKDDSLKAYHLACGKYINDPDIKELVVWMKYDKMRIPKISVGQNPIVEGIELYSMDKQAFRLKDLLIENRANLVVCGSYS